MKYLTRYLKDLDKSIACLSPKLDAATSEGVKLIEVPRKSMELADKLNACYYKSHGLIDSAKQLAAMKDKADLAELSNHELEEFFSQWNGNEIFRKEYNRRILWSLESRGLSKDGRIKNPDESPILPESLIPWYFLSSNKNLTESSKETRGILKEKEMEAGILLHKKLFWAKF